MPIGSVILHIDQRCDFLPSTQEWLRSHPQVTLGEEIQGKIPAVIDTTDLEENKALLEEITAAPGVRFVDVVFVMLDESEPVIELTPIYEVTR